LVGVVEVVIHHHYLDQLVDQLVEQVEEDKEVLEEQVDCQEHLLQVVVVAVVQDLLELEVVEVLDASY
jgi:hypothetical protein